MILDLNTNQAAVLTVYVQQWARRHYKTLPDMARHTRIAEGNLRAYLLEDKWDITPAVLTRVIEYIAGVQLQAMQWSDTINNNPVRTTK